MWFKTKKIKNLTQKKNVWFKRSIPYFIWIISIFVIWFLWLNIVKWIWTFSFKFDFKVPELISNLNINEDENNEPNQIKILLVWRWWWNHDAPNLTDSMILVSIDFDKSIISMLSVPRDLYVKYDEKRYGKINEVYLHHLSIEKNEEKAMENLKNKVSQITWEKIDYYLNIDFSWFKKIVDLLGWITVEVPETLVDYTYPDWKWWYTTFILKAWTWDIDWEIALKYARSRHSTSDFDRSLRQQKIISAIKEKIISEWYLKNPLKIRKLYNAMEPYFNTDIWINGILKIVSDFKWLWEDNNIISVNLNNSCFYWYSACQVWWILYNPPMDSFWWASVLLPRWADYYNLDKYSEIQRFSKLVFHYQEIFTDKQEINIFNSSWIPNKAMYLANDLQQFWFNIPKNNSIWNASWSTYENTTILYNNLWEDIKTLEALKLFMKWKYQEVESPIHSKNSNTKIEIVIWKDYTEITDFDWTKE